MVKHVKTGPRTLMMAFVLSTLCGIPSIAAAQSFPMSSSATKARPHFVNPHLSTAPLRIRANALRTSLTSRSLMTIKRPVLHLSRTPQNNDARVAAAPVTVELNGSYGALASGDVTVHRAGVVIARGSVSQAITVSGSGSVDIVVTATSLVDQPSIDLSGVALPANGGALTIPASIETGLVRAEATVDGRRISGVVRFYRIDATSGIASEQSCGSIGANGGSQEISTGRYRAVLNFSGATLSREFEVVAGSSRLVRLVG